MLDREGNRYVLGIPFIVELEVRLFITSAEKTENWTADHDIAFPDSMAKLAIGRFLGSC